MKIKTQIGPYSKDRIVLCSTDAHPDSQRKEPYYAGFFFPGATWVGAVRNAAQDLECRLVVLTTAHGMVDSLDLIGPYDLHIYADMRKVGRNWSETIPCLMGKNQCDLVVLYTGGCPREPYIELLKPVLHDNGISLIAFGKPNTFDSGRVVDVARLLMNGTHLEELRSILKSPDTLEFFPVES